MALRIRLLLIIMCLVNVMIGAFIYVVWQPRKISFPSEVMIKGPEEPVVLLYWSKFFGQKYELDKFWNKTECPVTCRATSDKKYASVADAFIVHGSDPYPLPPRKTTWILRSRENPILANIQSNAKYMSKFHLFMSYRLDSDFPITIHRKPSLAAPLPFANKTGMVMAAYTNCEPVRTKYMKILMKFITVDSYGACNHNKDGIAGRYDPDIYTSKIKMARNYKFSLVFFNQDCEYFVDEKIVDAFDSGSVPVVMATTKLNEFLPGNLRNAYINVRDFHNPEHLAKYLHYLSNNETEYNKYLKWKTEGIGSISEILQRVFSQSKVFCDVCVAVSQGKIHREGLKPVFCKQRDFADWNITDD